MRMSVDELKTKYCPSWNDEKHNIVRVCYGDDPLIIWDALMYEQYNKLDGTLANIEAINAYIYSQYGEYSIYRPLIGEILISNSILHEVLGGNISINGYTISLNLMYGLISLTITKNRVLDVVGFRTKDGIHSARLRKNTRELKKEDIEKLLNTSISDYGESVQKFMSACAQVYYAYPDNYILEGCFGDS